MIIRFGQWVIRLEKAAEKAILAITEPIERRVGLPLVWTVLGSILTLAVAWAAFLIWIRAGSTWLAAAVVLGALLCLAAWYARRRALRGDSGPPPMLTAA